MDSNWRELDWRGLDWHEYIIELPELNNVRHHIPVSLTMSSIVIEQDAADECVEDVETLGLDKYLSGFEVI